MMFEEFGKQVVNTVDDFIRVIDMLEHLLRLINKDILQNNQLSVVTLSLRSRRGRSRG